jgi:hypothetical protein
MEATNAMGFSFVDPGRLSVSIERCPSPSGDSLDMLQNSCGCPVHPSFSIFVIRRAMDAAEWGGGIELMLMRPTRRSSEPAEWCNGTAPVSLL